MKNTANKIPFFGKNNTDKKQKKKRTKNKNNKPNIEQKFQIK